MKRLTLVLSLGLVVMVASLAGAQTWQNPLPQGHTFRDVVIVDDHAWAVGDYGAIYHSVDTGVSWVPQPSAATAHLTGVSFADTAHGWVGGDGSILRTGDGVNWAEQCQGPHWDLRSVIALDARDRLGRGRERHDHPVRPAARTRHRP